MKFGSHTFRASKSAMLLSQYILRVSGATKVQNKNVLPIQPERHLIPSRVKWFSKRRRDFILWKSYAAKMKQLALTSRVPAPVPTVLAPVWEHGRYENIEYPPEASTEVFYPYKTRTRGISHRTLHSYLGIHYN
jgi:hypothetical protein